ncbi:hypothetical protein ACLB2K_037998 [Fragaria x ananassa]
MATYRALLSLKSSLDDPDSRLSALRLLNVFNRTFPPELSNLTNLRVLDLYNNNLTGVLPVSPLSSSTPPLPPQLPVVNEPSPDDHQTGQSSAKISVRRKPFPEGAFDHEQLDRTHSKVSLPIGKLSIWREGGLAVVVDWQRWRTGDKANRREGERGRVRRDWELLARGEKRGVRRKPRGREESGDSGKLEKLRSEN